MMTLSGALALFTVLIFCAFFAQKTKLNAALLPLPVLGSIVLWIFAFGLADLLWLGTLAVYLAGAAALGWLWRKNQLKEALNRLKTPGVIFFAGFSLFFLVLFSFTQPMFIQWDEFTFWGTASRLTKLQNVLHPAASGMLLARAYNPGLPLLGYFFQFFNPTFTEWGVYYAVNTLYGAALSAVAAPLSKKKWPAATVLLATGFLLPFFFAVPALGGVSNIYVTAMSDLFLGSVFGASLCLYLCSKNQLPGLVCTGLSLAFLTLIKDMGLAYALIAAGTMALDWLFAKGRPTLRRFGKTVGLGLAFAVPVPLLFLGWSKYVAALSGVDKTTVGNWEGSMSQAEMLLDGTKQLLGLAEPTERFSQVRSLIMASPFQVAVCLLGSGVMALAMIFAVYAVASLCLPKGEKHSPVIMFGVLLAGLVVFILFHMFLYTYNFSQQEAMVLKDYARYIGPYYLGFFMLGLGFLAFAMENGGAKQISHGVNLAITCGFALMIALRGTPAAGFLDYPRFMYNEREDIAARMEAINPYLQWDDTVLLIKQGERGTGWNYYGYAMNATLSGGFGGFGYGHPDDYTWPTTHMNIVSPEAAGPNVPEVYPYQTVCDAEDMKLFLQDKQYDYILVDTPDEYFAREIAPAFGLEGLPAERTTQNYLVKISYRDNGVQWSLVNGGDAQ